MWITDKVLVKKSAERKIFFEDDLHSIFAALTAETFH
jgi:hypothetical protein